MDSERQTSTTSVLAPPQGDPRKRRVVFFEDLAPRWGISVRTLQRRRKEGNLDIQEMPSLDNRVRYLLEDVEAFEKNRL